MKTKTARTLKRMLALLAAVAAIVTLLAMTASAKSAGGFQYVVDGPYGDDDESYAIITGHKSAVDGTLSVPAKIGGYEVRWINDAAFADRKDVTKVVVPAGILHVGAHAFDGCSNLRTLVIADAGIGEYAFAGCTSLKNVKITGYRFADCDPEWYWSEIGNDPLFAADWEWTHYKKDYDIVQSEVKTRDGAHLTLSADYDKFKNGDTYNWYVADGYGFYPDGEDGWEACNGKTVEGTVYSYGDFTVVCEVTDSKGDVVWAEEFLIHSRMSLVGKARNAVYESYLYGVTDYTVNHFRWKIEGLLDKMGFDVYGE